MSSAASKDSATTRFERAGWNLKMPATPLALEDARLLEYRHPAEHRMLTLALMAVSILVIVAIWLKEKDILVASAAIYLSMLGTSLQSLNYYRLQGAEVTPAQFPAIYQMMEELRQRFRAPPAHVFILRKLSFEAEALGLRAPYVIVLPSALIDALEPEELHYVLGQALGHICFGHTRLAFLIGGKSSTLPAVLSWIAWVRDLIFAGYWRAAMMSSDRAGILAYGDVRKAIRAQVKISVGTSQLPEVRAEDLVEQAFRVSQGVTRFQAMLIRWQSATPLLIPRLEAMVSWAGLPSAKE
jgi:Zn-dependent protease with chaperone function